MIFPPFSASSGVLALDAVPPPTACTTREIKSTPQNIIVSEHCTSINITSEVGYLENLLTEFWSKATVLSPKASHQVTESDKERSRHKARRDNRCTDPIERRHVNCIRYGVYNMGFLLDHNRAVGADHPMISPMAHTIKVGISHHRLVQIA